MGNLKIITGHTNSAHVTSNDDGEFNQGIWGDGVVILSVGNKMAATISSNVVTVSDGDLVFQGRHALIASGSSEQLSLTAGTSGYNRKDLICVQYTKNGSGIESMNLVVKRGTAVTGTASDPSYTSGTIRTGSTTAEAPLFRVTFSGTSASIARVASVIPYGVDILRKKIEYGTSLPSVSGYNEGDIFLKYS